MEQAMRGQIGQPAACMIENKESPPRRLKLCDYGPRPDGSSVLPGRGSAAGCFELCHPTKIVDNFVKKYLDMCSQAASMRSRNKTITNEAVKNSKESMTCNESPWPGATFAILAVQPARLWSNALQHVSPSRISTDVRS
jgi:hypothetical protein